MAAYLLRSVHILTSSFFEEFSLVSLSDASLLPSRSRPKVIRGEEEGEVLLSGSLTSLSSKVTRSKASNKYQSYRRARKSAKLRLALALG